MTLEQGAALPVTYLTAHHMLHHLGGLKPGHTVLVHGGAGGVGTAALQLCRWAGSGQVWATASAPKRGVVEALGGTFIDRHAEDFVAIVKRATNGRGWTTCSTRSAGRTLSAACRAWRKADGSTPTPLAGRAATAAPAARSDDAAPSNENRPAPPHEPEPRRARGPWEPGRTGRP